MFQSWHSFWKIVFHYFLVHSFFRVDKCSFWVSVNILFPRNGWKSIRFLLALRKVRIFFGKITNAQEPTFSFHPAKNASIKDAFLVLRTSNIYEPSQPGDLFFFVQDSTFDGWTSGSRTDHIRDIPQGWQLCTLSHEWFFLSLSLISATTVLCWGG